MAEGGGGGMGGQGGCSRMNGIARTLEESAHGHPRESVLPHVIVLEVQCGKIPGADGIFEVTLNKTWFERFERFEGGSEQ